jgi:hypothetical protein
MRIELRPFQLAVEQRLIGIESEPAVGDELAC